VIKLFIYLNFIIVLKSLFYFWPRKCYFYFTRSPRKFRLRHKSSRDVESFKIPSLYQGNKFGWLQAS